VPVVLESMRSSASSAAGLPVASRYQTRRQLASDLLQTLSRVGGARGGTTSCLLRNVTQRGELDHE
jgi:hypothetical protein